MKKTTIIDKATICKWYDGNLEQVEKREDMLAYLLIAFCCETNPKFNEIKLMVQVFCNEILQSASVKCFKNTYHLCLE